MALSGLINIRSSVRIGAHGTLLMGYFGRCQTSAWTHLLLECNDHACLHRHCACTQSKYCWLSPYGHVFTLSGHLVHTSLITLSLSLSFLPLALSPLFNCFPHTQWLSFLFYQWVHLAVCTALREFPSTRFKQKPTTIAGVNLGTSLTLTVHGRTMCSLLKLMYQMQPSMFTTAVSMPWVKSSDQLHHKKNIIKY